MKKNRNNKMRSNAYQVIVDNYTNVDQLEPLKDWFNRDREENPSGHFSWLFNDEHDEISSRSDLTEDQENDYKQLLLDIEERSEELENEEPLTEEEGSIIEEQRRRLGI